MFQMLPCVVKIIQFWIGGGDILIVEKCSLKQIPNTWLVGDGRVTTNSIPGVSRKLTMGVIMISQVLIRHILCVVSQLEVVFTCGYKHQ